MHEGHRQRMLRRLNADERSMQDHELVEVLLYNAIPRKNTNETAHRLLEAFGSLDGIFHASFEQLCRIEGVGKETAAYLRTIAVCNERMRFNDTSYPEKFNFASYCEFIGKRFKGLAEEVVEIYALDSTERVKCTARFTSHDAGKAAVNPEKLSQFMIGSHADGIVVAHNHPQERAKASAADDEFTAFVALSCSQYNAKFYDHIIVGTDGFYSYFRDGRIDKFRENYSMKNILKSNKQ